MKISRLDLDGVGSPTALVTRIYEIEPNLPIPVPIEDLCLALDIVAIKEMDTKGFEAALVTDRLKASGAILVAQGRSRRRRRFSIAHELGHFVIPAHLPPVTGAFQCTPDDLLTSWSREQSRVLRMEAEANRFAAALLMPPLILRGEIRKARAPNLDKVLRLSDFFDVSREALSRAYVEQSREAIVIIVTRHGRVVRSYRGADRFPWLGVTSNDLVPQTSIFHSKPNAVGVVTSVVECDPDTWLDYNNARKVQAMTEQVFVQNDSFALILLHANMNDEEDEGEDSDERRSSWRPRF